MGKRPRTDDPPADSNDSGPVSASSPAKIQEVEAYVAGTPMPKMQCSLPPHQSISFDTAGDFDIHYIKEHTNRCSSCGKNFPSAHYLTIHIDENHNPIREAIAAQGERTYACFVEDCDRKCSTPQKRRLHLIDKHMFPRAYNFRIVDQGIDKSGSLLLTGQRRRLSSGTKSLNKTRQSSLTEASSSTYSPTSTASTVQSTSVGSSPNATDGIENELSSGVDSLEQSFAALRFVPPSVQARQRGKKNQG